MLKLSNRFLHSVNAAEIAKFNALAKDWWNPRGVSKMLHLMNPARIAFISDSLGDMSGKSILDIGSGGGILTESLCRLSATVTGVDAAEENVKIANAHAKAVGIITGSEGDHIKYIHGTAEEMPEQDKFDVVCAMEILEHVNDPQTFLQTCTRLLKPNGWLFASTINKTPLSYALSIVAAEHVLGMVPVGTHDHSKFISPMDLKNYIERADCRVQSCSGMVFNPVSGEWVLVPADGQSIGSSLATQVNYIMAAKKLSE